MCNVCEKGEVVAYVKAEFFPRRKDGLIVHNEVCRDCLRKVMRAMKMEEDFPPELKPDVIDIFDDLDTK